MSRSWVRRTARASTLVVAVAGAVAGVMPATLSAQRTVASLSERSGGTAELFARPVTVRIDGMPLKRAIDAIAASAKVRVQYQEEIVSAETKSVTLQANGAPLGSVLARVLSGTSLRAVPVSENYVSIEPSATHDAASVAQGSVEGTVVHAKTKQPVVGATVLLDGATKGVVTDEQGRFRLPASAGSHTVVVRAVGFTRQSITVNVVEERASALAVALEPSTSVLNEVIVTGTVVATERKAIPTPITVVTADEIEKRGITQIDQLFRGVVPGVFALDVGTNRYMGNAINGGADSLGQMVASKVITRGVSSMSNGGYGTANPLKTYVDGVEILDAAYLGTIDPRSIERVEIITGPQAATIYGSGAMGGVMQIFTKKGTGSTRTDVSLRLQYGVLQNSFSNGKTPQHNDAFSVSGGTGPQFSYAGTLTYNYTGQWQPDLFARQYGGSLGATYTQGPLTASGNVSLTSGANGTTGWRGVQSSPFNKAMIESGEFTQQNRSFYNTQRVSTSNTQTSSLNVDYRLSTLWQHHLVLGRSQTNFALVPEAPVFYDNSDTLYRNTTSTGQRTTLSYNTTLQSRVGVLSSSLTTGINGSWGAQTQVLGCQTSKDATSYVGCNGIVDNGLVNVNKTLDSKSWGGFGSWQVGVMDHLYITFGLRGERNPSYGREHKIDWTPTTGAAYTMELGDLTVKLLGSYGRSTKPPVSSMRLSTSYVCPVCDPSQFLMQLENNNLRPEYSSGPQGGIELYYGNLGTLTINHYKQTITDLIQFVPADSIWLTEYSGSSSYSRWYQQYQYMNTGTIAQIGWEATGSTNVGPLSLKGTYSWNDSRVRTSLLSYVYPGMSFWDVPSHTGNVTANYALGGTSILLSMNYIGTAPKQTGGCCGPITPGRYRIRTYVPRMKDYEVYGVAPGYVKSDLTVSQRVSPWASLTMTVLNLTNDYTSDADLGFPTLGRQTLFGVALRYPKSR